MITATPAAWIPTLTFEALPPRARSRAKLAIFDACGTALAGTHHPAVQHLRQLLVEMGSAPQARLIGDRLCLSLLDAAWLTGTMVEAYLYRAIRISPAMATLPRCCYLCCWHWEKHGWSVVLRRSPPMQQVLRWPRASPGRCPPVMTATAGTPQPWLGC